MLEVHIQWQFLSNCLLLLQDVFLKLDLPWNYSNLSVKMLQVCRCQSHIEIIHVKVSSPVERVIAIVFMFLKVLILVVFEDELRSFELISQVNMNSEEIQRQSITLFCGINPRSCCSVCKILQKEEMFAFSCSLFLTLFKTHLCDYC